MPTRTPRSDPEPQPEPEPSDGPAPATVDPYDLEALRELPDYGFDSKRDILEIAARRPKPDEYIRTHPDPAFIVPNAVLLEHNDGEETRQYWVAKQIWPELQFPELKPSVRYVRLITTVNRRGVPFLWPARLLSESSRSGAMWYRSALAAAEQAQRYWLRMVGNRAAGAYEIFKAMGDLGEPVWPDLALRDMIGMAFRDTTITTMEHPAIRQLLGEI
jgi:hypothetical protein